MKLLRTCIVVLALPMTAAHAQLNQIFGAVQSVQSAIEQAKSPDKPDIPSPAALLQQAKGLAAQQSWAEKSAQASQEHDDQMSDSRAQYNAFMEQRQAEAAAGQAAGDKRVRDAEEHHQKAQQEDAQRAAQAAAQARAACPELADTKSGLGSAIVTCKNRGMPEQDMMAAFGDAPMAAQAYVAAIVQDVYEDNIRDPRRGNDVYSYYDKCYRRRTTCARPQW